MESHIEKTEGPIEKTEDPIEKTDPLLYMDVVVIIYGVSITNIIISYSWKIVIPAMAFPLLLWPSILHSSCNLSERLASPIENTEGPIEKTDCPIKKTDGPIEKTEGPIEKTGPD